MTAWRARDEIAIAGVELWGCEPSGSAGALAVRIDHHPGPPASAEVKREWARMTAENPRLFDGPVLSVVCFDPERGEMLCRGDSYQRLSVQPRVRTGVKMLGVTALLVGRDERGRERVMLGRRGEQTRIYGGMWELGPAGGLDSWHPGQMTIDPAAVIEQAADEAREEAGIEIPAAAGGTIVGVLRDDLAFSYDLIVRFEVGELGTLSRGAVGAGRPDGWEYTGVEWVATDELGAFDRREKLIGPTRAIIAAMGWMRP